MAKQPLLTEWAGLLLKDHPAIRAVPAACEKLEQVVQHVARDYKKAVVEMLLQRKPNAAVLGRMVAEMPATPFGLEPCAFSIARGMSCLREIPTLTGWGYDIQVALAVPGIIAKAVELVIAQSQTAETRVAA